MLSVLALCALLGIVMAAAPGAAGAGTAEGGSEAGKEGAGASGAGSSGGAAAGGGAGGGKSRNDDPAVRAALASPLMAPGLTGSEGPGGAGDAGGEKVRLSDGTELTIAEIEKRLGETGELVKGSNKKMEEAAELRKRAESELASAADYKELAQMWTTGKSPAAPGLSAAQVRAAVMQHLFSIADPEAQSLIRQVVTGGAASASAKPGGVLPEGMTFESKMEEFLHGQLQAALSKIDQLGTQVQALGGVIPEVKGFIGSQKDAQQVEQWKAALKSSFGYEATDEQIAKMRDSGITDPLKAFEFFKPMLEQSFVKGSEKRSEGGAPPGTPTSGGKTFDPYDPKLRPGEISRLLAAGFTPVDSSGKPIKIGSR